MGGLIDADELRLPQWVPDVASEDGGMGEVKRGLRAYNSIL